MAPDCLSSLCVGFVRHDVVLHFSSESAAVCDTGVSMSRESGAAPRQCLCQFQKTPGPGHSTPSPSPSPRPSPSPSPSLFFLTTSYDKSCSVCRIVWSRGDGLVQHLSPMGRVSMLWLLGEAMQELKLYDHWKTRWRWR